MKCSEAKNSDHGLKYLQEIEQIVYKLNDDNIKEVTELLMNLYNSNFQNSFILIVCQLIYSLFLSKPMNISLYIQFIYFIYEKTKYKIFEIFTQVLLNNESHESYYFLEKLIEQNIISKEIAKAKTTFLFISYLSKKDFHVLKEEEQFQKFFNENLSELSKNDWELHKKLIEEGVNPNEIAKIIRSDEIEKLQEISSQANFDFNQTIEPSLYERCSFVNHKNVTLIDYAAFFSSVQCFKYLLMNGAKVENTGKYAVAGGNEEIIHLCEQNHSSFEGAYETAIKFHRNDIFKYIYENKILNFTKPEEAVMSCITSFNYEVFSFLEESGIKIDRENILEVAKLGNLFFVKYFINKNNYIPNNLLIESTSSGNIDLVKYVSEQNGIDINFEDFYFFYLKFKLFDFMFSI